MVKEDVDIGREQLRVTGVGGECKKGGRRWKEDGNSGR